MANDTEYFVPAKKPNKGFKIARLIKLPSFDDRPRIEYGYEGRLAQRIRFEFYPSKLGYDGLLELHGIMSSLVPDGWKRFVMEGKITRIDVAVDLVELLPVSWTPR